MAKKYTGYVIYTDLDGTLLNDEKEVSVENRKAIEYFIENAGRFSIATGRAFEATEKYIKGLDIDIPAIVYIFCIFLFDFNDIRYSNRLILFLSTFFLLSL